MLHGAFMMQGAAAGGETDPNFSDVALLLHMNGTDGSTTFTDSSSNGNTVTANGDAQIDTAQSKFGGASGLFDGTNDYISITDDVSLDLGSSDFTAEGWFRVSSLASTPQNLMGINIASGSSGYGFRVQIQTSGSIRVLISSTGSSWQLIKTESASLSVDTWYHFAVVRSGSDIHLFLDGSQLGTASTYSGTIVDGPIHWMGCLYDNGTPTQDLNGWLDDVRLTIGAARYTSNFTPPSEEFPDS